MPPTPRPDWRSPRERHPVDAKGRVVVQHDGRGVEPGVGVHRGGVVAGEDRQPGRPKAARWRARSPRPGRRRRRRTRPARTPPGSTSGSRPAAPAARWARSRLPIRPGRRRAVAHPGPWLPRPRRGRARLLADGSSGPTSVSARSGSPTRRRRARWASRFRKLGGDGPVRRTRAAPTRRPAQHGRSRPWPAPAPLARDRRRRRRSPVLHRRARARTARRAPGASAGFQPTAALPMKLKKPTRGSVTSCWLSSRLSMTSGWHHSCGSPASCRMVAKRRQDSGVSVAGLTMTGQPAAMAGATWCTIRLSGWLKALTATTTPIGSRWVKASRPAEAALRFMGTTWPASERRSSAQCSTPSIARATSTRESTSGLPPSRAASRARSSACCSMSRAVWRRIVDPRCRRRARRHGRGRAQRLSRAPPRRPQHHWRRWYGSAAHRKARVPPALVMRGPAPYADAAAARGSSARRPAPACSPSSRSGR